MTAKHQFAAKVSEFYRSMSKEDQYDALKWLTMKKPPTATERDVLEHIQDNCQGELIWKYDPENFHRMFVTYSSNKN